LILNGRYISKVCRKYPDLRWAGDLGEKLSMSIVLYMACGAFLSVSTHPILYDIAAISLGLRHFVNRELAEREGESVPAARRRWAPDDDDDGEDDEPEGAPRQPVLYGTRSWRQRREMRLARQSVGANPPPRRLG
jgi:hypothetical protein